MHKRIPIKNHVEEIQLVTHRVIAALVIMIILIGLLITRLGYLQLKQHTLYTTLSKNNSLDVVPIEPTRGLIYDRNGVLLAENIPIFSLDIIPNKIDNIPKTLAEIAKIIPLTDTEIAQFQRQLKQFRRFDEITLKLRLNEEEVAKFSEQQYRFHGVIIKARLMRHYPFGGSFIHALGYVGRINTQELQEIDPSNYSASNYMGKLGIEKYYEDELHGTVGHEQVENDASGEPLRILNRINPVPGTNLYLTIDSRLQLAAEQALEGHRGSVVAIEPKTGQILAMVSNPIYDPNEFVIGVSSQEFKTLQESPDRPLYNRALRGLYPPASTVKPYIALQGLNTGVTNTSYKLYDRGSYQLKNNAHIFHDWKRHGHGTVNIAKAVTVSCDIYFFDLANKLGIERIGDLLTQFGFGQLSGIDVGEELAGNVPTPAWKRRVKGLPWFPGDTLNSGIGQGFVQVTPLQLASAVSTMANKGERYLPHLLLGQLEPGKPYRLEKPTLLNKIELSDPNYWNVVINAMEDVVRSSEGTAHYRYGDKVQYTIAAKTGTAQNIKKKNYDADHENQEKLAENLRDNSLFVAFAPVEEPKIAIAVVVENSLTAVSVARKVLDYYLVGPQALPPPDSAKKETEDDINDVH